MKGPHRTEARRPPGGRAEGTSGNGEGGGEPSGGTPTPPAIPPDQEHRREPSVGAGPGTDPESTEAQPAPEVEPAVDYKDRWLRAEAELQNFRRRSQRDLEEAVRFNEEGLLLEMISQLDDLERALEAAGESGAPESWVQGVRLVANRMSDSLARRGVTPLDPVGEAFDPEFHEAMLEVDAPEAAVPGQVVQVVRKGYRRGGRALRPARVVVARRAAAGGS